MCGVGSTRLRLGLRRVAAAAMLVAALAVSAAPDPILEPFDPRSHYGYRLDASDAARHAVMVTAHGFDWPSRVDGDTSFLEIEVRRASGREPGIRVRRGAVELHQVFERGARGRRFVDLSPLLAARGDAGAVALASEGVEWEQGPATLFVFRNPPIDELRVLVVAPHPDDAEIAAFGLYSRADADVVTVTAGDAGGKGFAALFPEEGEHYRVKGWIRTLDSITVPSFGGVEPGRARNLGFYDATLAWLWKVRPDPVEPPLATLETPGWYRELNVDPVLREREFASNWPALVDDLAAELARVEPRVVVAPHPLLDRHLDHRFTALALLEALETWQGECELWLYTNHAIENEAWPLGPRSAMAGLPPWRDGKLFFSRLYSHPLDAGEQKRKLVALEAMHDLRPFDPRDGSAPTRPRNERRRASRYDYFRRAPRPNELFFVTTRADAARLREAFLERAAGIVSSLAED